MIAIVSESAVVEARALLSNHQPGGLRLIVFPLLPSL